MKVVYERCCGIDVHKQTVVACAIVPGADRQPVKDTRTFATLTENLEALAGWLQGLGVTHVAMESTGVYWKQNELRTCCATGCSKGASYPRQCCANCGI
jgi:transposase